MFGRTAAGEHPGSVSVTWASDYSYLDAARCCSKEPMDYNSKPGTKVTFTGGSDDDLSSMAARTVLTVGQTYTVDWIEIGSYECAVFLVEHPRLPFNTLFFEPVDEDPEWPECEAQAKEPPCEVVLVDFRQMTLPFGKPCTAE
jgi:hypothetical protein